MTDKPTFEPQFFDPQQSHSISYKQLPHWAQAGAICFITWRTADSLPKASIGRLNEARQKLLGQFDLDPNSNWREKLQKLPPKPRSKLQWLLFTNWDEELDRAAGACALADPTLSKIVIDALRHFDGDRYALTDAVVMPNHVHLLVVFRDEDALVKQCKSWKHYTSVQINQKLREGVYGGETKLPTPPPSGEFWQFEQFDHLVRSPEEFDHYRKYIAENPIKAKLKLMEFRHYTKAIEA